jgi:hypothetical protein
MKDLIGWQNAVGEKQQIVEKTVSSKEQISGQPVATKARKTSARTQPASQPSGL